MFEQWTSPVTGEQYQLYYCNLCDNINIKCAYCENGSCNGMGCDKCIDDFKLFSSLGFSIYSYMSEEEMRLFERIDYIKRWVKHPRGSLTPLRRLCDTSGLVE
jgi:hypothetical protein